MRKPGDDERDITIPLWAFEEKLKAKAPAWKQEVARDYQVAITDTEQKIEDAKFKKAHKVVEAAGKALVLNAIKKVTGKDLAIPSLAQGIKDMSVWKHS